MKRVTKDKSENNQEGLFTNFQLCTSIWDYENTAIITEIQDGLKFKVLDHKLS